jgi:hypothetical protein
MGKNVTISTLPNIGQNYLPKINTSSIFANSLVYDNGTNVILNGTATHTDYASARLVVNNTNNSYLEVRSTAGQSAIVLTTATATSSNYPTIEIFNSANFGIVGYRPGVVSSNYIISYDLASNSNRRITFQTEGSNRFIINQNGTAEFTQALSGTSATFSGNLNLQGAVTRNINFYDSSNTNINAQIQYDQISSNSGQLFFGTNNAGTFATRLTISNTGAATFSSSIAASGTISISTDVTMLRFGNLLRWGFQRPAADNRYVSFMRNMNATATAVWTVDGDNGNVGIGTTSVTNKLIVVGSETGTQITTPPIGKFVNIGNTFSKFIIGSDNANYDAVMSMDNNATLANTKLRIYIGNGTNSTAGHSNDQIVLQGNGRVGIGTSSPSGKFDVYTGVGATFRAIYSTNNQVEVSNYNATDGYREMLLGGSPITFYTGTAGGGQITEKMRITSGANFQRARTSEFDNNKELVSNAQTTFLTVTSNSFAVVRLVIEYVATRNNSGTVVYQSGRYVVFYTANVGQHSAYANETLGTSFITWNVSLSANVLTVQANPGTFNNSSAIYYRAYVVCSDAGTSISLT